MMVFVIESVVLCLVFTVMVYIMSRKPIQTLYNYPPKIQERVKLLEEYKDQIPTEKNKVTAKAAASILFVVVISLILRFIIGEYDPARDRVTALYEGRSQGSHSLSKDVSVEELENKLKGEKEHSLEYNRLNQKIESVKRGSFGLHAGAELSRIHSDELRSIETVTFGDLYDVFSSLNEASRGYVNGSGKLRGYGVKAGKIKGVGASHAPQVLYETLEKIADGMNAIKRTDDPLLRKSMAVELAAFSYQTLLSEHLFMDGNGRTCRMFADTILQTFGLPPHIPGTLNEMGRVSPKFVGTLGNELDFKAGAQYFLIGIQKSDTRRHAPVHEKPD